MIGRLRGRLVEKLPPQVVIDVNGVGYEVDVSMQTFYALPALNEEVLLYTQLIVREDAHLLFGFMDAGERATFRQLLKVSGIGAKTALGILSALSPDDLAQAVAQEDVKKLSSAPSVGKKTAERMILELRGKLAVSGQVAVDLLAESAPVDKVEDVVQTLLALGYNEKEARVAVKGLASDVDVGDGVKFALKNLMR